VCKEGARGVEYTPAEAGNGVDSRSEEVVEWVAVCSAAVLVEAAVVVEQEMVAGKVREVELRKEVASAVEHVGVAGERSCCHYSG
jgi:hypothetical protein